MEALFTIKDHDGCLHRYKFAEALSAEYNALCADPHICLKAEEGTFYNTVSSDTDENTVPQVVRQTSFLFCAEQVASMQLTRNCEDKKIRFVLTYKKPCDYKATEEKKIFHDVEQVILTLSNKCMMLKVKTMNGSCLTEVVQYPISYGGGQMTEAKTVATDNRGWYADYFSNILSFCVQSQ